MKKILFFTAIVVSLFSTSCSKEIFVGEERDFVYVPTNLRASAAITLNGNTATVFLNDGRSVNVRVLSSSQRVGDAFFLEAPIVPQRWVWDQQNNQYVPSGFDYNVSYGFTASAATVYFVEILGGIPSLFKRSVSWANTPNPASWVNSFEKMIGSTRRNMPIMGTISKEEGFPDRYFFSN